MTLSPGGKNGIISFAHDVLLWVGVVSMVALLPSVAPAAGNGDLLGDQKETQTSVNNRSAGFGIDPDTACSDANQDQQITPDECQGRDWSWTSTDPQIPAPVNNQNGVGLPPGASAASIGQSADQTISAGPHFSVRNYNKPSKPDTTATTGYGSTSNGSVTNHHNEYGFEIVVDKKTDPLEPYYQRFTIPFYSVDSQTDVDGNMVGQASVSYEKVVTEEDPANPGVFNRYTVTGTATSGGSTGNYSSQCESGCTTDPETGWSHPWQ